MLKHGYFKQREEKQHSISAFFRQTSLGSPFSRVLISLFSRFGTTTQHLNPCPPHNPNESPFKSILRFLQIYNGRNKYVQHQQHKKRRKDYTWYILFNLFSTSLLSSAVLILLLNLSVCCITSCCCYSFFMVLLLFCFVKGFEVRS